MNNPDRVTSQEVDARYDLGFNLNLPFGWTGKVGGGQTIVEEKDSTTGTINANMVSAALGWSVAGVPANLATNFAIGSFTKPSNIPLLEYILRSVDQYLQ